jgi:hypothetical protein
MDSNHFSIPRQPPMADPRNSANSSVEPVFMIQLAAHHTGISPDCSFPPAGRTENMFDFV